MRDEIRPHSLACASCLYLESAAVQFCEVANNWLQLQVEKYQSGDVSPHSKKSATLELRFHRQAAARAHLLPHFAKLTLGE